MKKTRFYFLLFIPAFIFLFVTSALSNQCRAITKEEIIVEENGKVEEASGGEVLEEGEGVEKAKEEKEVNFKPAEFKVSNLTFNPSQAMPGEAVITSVDVSNVGDVDGTYLIELNIDGVVEEAENINLAGGETDTISFTVQKEIVKSYLVKIEDLIQSFEIIAPPEFVIGNSLFHFIGAGVTGWHWYGWSKAADEDLVKSARNNGITVLHLMYHTPFELQLGVYNEEMLVKLDHLLDCASRHGIYVTITFIDTLLIANSKEDSYYNPHGIEGLIRNEALAGAFKRRIEMFLTRKNTINGREYREDPTILAWVICNEPVSNPLNYAEGPPDVTESELQTWFGEIASYIKNIDSNHMVTVYHTRGTPGDDGISGWKAWDVPSLDFIMTEKNLSDIDHSEYPIGLFSLEKPVVIGVAFPSMENVHPTTEEWNQEWNNICNDYPRQAQLLKEAILSYYERGAAGVRIPPWMSDLVIDKLPPGKEECFNYTSSDEPVTEALRDAATQLGPAVYPPLPLQFVKVSNKDEITIGI